MSGHTPGPWWVRLRRVNGEILDCFVAAKDFTGCAYDAEILGDDEYREESGIERKLADCTLVAAAPQLLKACQQALVALKGREHDGFLRDAIALATQSQQEAT